MRDQDRAKSEAEGAEGPDGRARLTIPPPHRRIGVALRRAPVPDAAGETGNFLDISSPLPPVRSGCFATPNLRKTRVFAPQGVLPAS